MRLTVLGATGQTGTKLVELALGQGDRVTALVRDRAKLGELASRLDIVLGDATDQAAVEKAVEGSDAVLSALGHVKGSAKDIEAAALKKVVASMNSKGVKRLVVLSSSVVGDPADKPTLGQSFTSWLVKTFRRDIYDDSLAKARVVQESGLDWTVVRASILTNGPATKYRVGRMEKGMGLRVSRADVADLMLKCSTEGKYVRELPYISG